MTQTTPLAKSPSHAEQARTLASLARFGALATIARDPAGFPYASLVALVADGAGRPLFLLSRLAEHTQNLLASADASVLLFETNSPPQNPLEKGRVTLLGPCAEVPAEEKPACREVFLAAHPDAATYVDFSDFSFFRLEPRSLRYIAGFARMSWVDAAAYSDSEPDPLAAFASRILAHMNDDHADSILAYARVLAGIAEATGARMTAVDRYGFDMIVETAAGARRARLPFSSDVKTREEARKALVEMAMRVQTGG